MFGYVLYREAEQNTPPLRAIRGARLRAVYVAAGSGPRARLSARAAARTLAREGIREAVFPAEYPLTDAFARRGVRPVSPVPLYRATAAAIARRYMAQRGVDPERATVAFAAERVSPELTRAITSLAADVRYIALALPLGGEELARRLRHDLGVAPRLVFPGERLCADLTLCFDARETAGAALALYDESLAVAYDAPEDVSNALLAALLRTGALDASSLRVSRAG